MKASLFKRKRKYKGKVSVSPCWSIKYRLDGERRYQVHPLEVQDKQVASELLTAFIREKEREAQGIIPPAALRDAAAKSMYEHLTDFAADLKSKGRAKKYVKNVQAHTALLIDELSWKRLADVSADSFISWRNRQTAKAPKTLNAYRDAAYSLLAWMVRIGRAEANSLAAVDKLRTKGKEVRVRRALTLDESRRLLAVSGKFKATYLMALLTGLRRNELKQLVWGDVHLDAPVPYVSVRAATTKNGKQAMIRLRDDLYAELRGCRGDNAAVTCRVLRVPHAETRLAHFKAAGIKSVDAAGKIADFHALRKTFSTMLAVGGVSLDVRKELMRHSDVRLTDENYTDKAHLPLWDAVDHLPTFLPEHEAEAVRMVVGAEKDFGTQIRTQNSVQTRANEALAVIERPIGQAEEILDLPGKSRDLAGYDSAGHLTEKKLRG